MRPLIRHPVVAIGLSCLAVLIGIPWGDASLVAVEDGASGPVRVSSGAITAVCRLTLGGSFEAVSKAMGGEMTVGDGGQVSGTLQVPLDSFDTGIGLRNTHMRENYLETGKGAGFAHATLTQMALARPAIVTGGGESDFDATLTLHGVTRPVHGTVRLTPASGVVKVEARFPLSLSSYAIPEPRYLGIGVRDNVEVRVDATFALVGGAR